MTRRLSPGLLALLRHLATPGVSARYVEPAWNATPAQRRRGGHYETAAGERLHRGRMRELAWRGLIEVVQPGWRVVVTPAGHDALEARDG